VALSKSDITEILRIVDGAPVGELLVRTEGFTLHLTIGDGSQSAGSPLAAGPAEAPLAPAVPGPPPPTAPGTGTAPPVPGTEAIEAPMLGTFYRADAPGAAPFIDLGARVEPDTIVCIIEVMKMMNSVPAGVSGTVVEVVAQNGTLVEFGEPLFRVEL
jgi:acetyl-CoA carboxylase biotin carboxyl carrier protein